MYTSNKMLKIFCIVIGLSMLCSCDNTSERQQIFYDKVKGINVNHALETSRIPNININDYTPRIKPQEFREVGFTEKELDSLTDYDKHGNTVDSISYEQAETDVELVFRIFKNCYSAYYYFGGDEAFEKAKEQVISDCKLAGENLTVGTMQESLRKHLNFVTDGHFLVDNKQVFGKTEYYSNEERTFFKDEKGYYTEQKGKKRYVSSVEGSNDVEKYMKLSVNGKGILVHKLGVLSIDEIDMVDVAFEDSTENFELSLPELKDVSGAGIYSYEEINNVPVVGMRSFIDQSACEQFNGAAEIIKNSKVSILDLRGNLGGHAYNVTRWLNIYDPVLSDYSKGNIFAVRNSRANSYLGHIRYRADLPERNETTASNSLAIYRTGINRWEISENMTFERSENNNLLFVLVDTHTYSAGELLMSALRNKDNVIFVGTNSNGSLMSDDGVKIVLPNSKINIQCGSVLRFDYDETVFSEETGFRPDIWVGTDSLENTLNLISYYGLNK
ncbi:hypothetical protein HZF24_08370 [Sedimentibacter hydroxybenzoicus DSM 7310]|uniref:Tail specific protease domain-containing protein n=2 Tax=Sedimentibacter hydroxybenzoicus TaxID=29345 RepID=A0A974BJB9_SEDHY|nr:hypothetical protein [Sedimentibacter hydroxybenzoicus DSM 7310]